MKTVRLLVLFLLSASLHAYSQNTVSVSRSSGTEKITYMNSTGATSFSVEVRGKLELTDDDKDIKSMSSNGYLEVSKTTFGSRRALIVTPQGNGLKREYYEGRTLTSFEPEGRKWMGEILPELVRTTTIGAEARVARIYKNGGTPAVLAEIAQLENDDVKAGYASILMGMAVNPKDYPVIIQRVSGSIDSDHYKAQFLQNGLDKFLTTKEATDALFTASGTIDSDHYKSEVIRSALKSQSASPEAVKIILQATSKMDSDHYKSEVLTTLLNQPGLNDGVIADMIATTRSLDSDHYKSLVLNKALEKNGLSSVSYQRVLESVKEMDSDHYKAQVINNLLRVKLGPAQVQNLVSISGSIESDHYTTEVLNTLLSKQDLSDDNLKIVTDRVATMESDHYKSIVLQSALKLGNLSSAKVQSILNATSSIDSDHYITQVLTDAAPKVRAGDENLKNAYRAAAKKIGSETYYGRAIKALD